jgi:hypothetical protein
MTLVMVLYKIKYVQSSLYIVRFFRGCPFKLPPELRRKGKEGNMGTKGIQAARRSPPITADLCFNGIYM